MRSLIQILAMLLMVTALLAPDIAQARAGSGMSGGTRGARTYQSSPSGASPIQRSTTAPDTATSSPAATGLGAHPFATGVAGGLLGMGLGHMLFGGMGGMGGGGGGLIQLLLIGGLIYYGMRYFRSRQNGQGMPSFMTGAVSPFAAQGARPDNSTSVLLADSDLAAFRQTFLDIQHAWSDGNFDKLRQFVTPEMLHYFNDELAANTSRGVDNKMDNIVVEAVEPVESWQEYSLTYASVIIRWAASDYMVRLGSKPGDADYIAEGSPTATEEVAEQWTFSRIQGGHWLLSAIQQLG